MQALRKSLPFLLATLLLGAASCKSCDQDAPLRFIERSSVAAGIEPASAQVSDGFTLSGPTQAYAWARFGDFGQAAATGFSGWTARCTVLQVICMPRTALPSRRSRTGGKTVAIADMLSGKLGFGNPPVFFDVVLFNQPAATYIQNLCQVAPSPCIANANFPSGPAQAEILRPIWGWVPENSDGHLYLYNTTKVGVFLPGGAPYMSAVTIQMDATPCPPTSLDNAQTIPLSCFYSVHMPTAVWPTAYHPEGPSPYPQPAPGTLVLVGFHVMKREVNGWTFTTFYWQADIQNASYTCATSPTGSPVGCPSNGQWNRYAMKAVDTPPNSTVPMAAVSNPYFEGGHENGPQTNCLVCHGFASDPLNSHTPEGVLISRSNGATDPISSSIYTKTHSTFINQPGRTSADFVWSVAQAGNTGPLSPSHN